MEKNPWTTLDAEVKYDNPWITVEHRNVITPGGTKGIYGTVSFKNLAIGVIPLDDSRNTWLVGQYRYPLDLYSWEIPMGGGSVHADPLLTAQLELKEETGIRAHRWTKLMEVHPSNSVTDELGMVFLAEDLTYGATNYDITEEIKVRKIPFQEAFEMVMKGQITDAISVAGILKCQLLYFNN